MPPIRDQAICIRVWDWSETSQTVSLFAREHGILRGVAKGSKRENAKFSGGIEILTRGEVLASVKPGAETLALLTAWDLLEPFPAARQSLSAFYAGMGMLELVHHAVRDVDPHPGLYDALLVALRSLGEESRDKRALLNFLWSVLEETGHMPEIFQDVRTGKPLETAATYGFGPRLGGVTRDDNAAAVGDEVWRVRAETIELLRLVAHKRDLVAQPSATVARATKLLGLYFRAVFGVEVKGLEAAIDR